MGLETGTSAGGTGESIHSRSFCYAYPRPAVTVDLAVFAHVGDTLRVLLIRVSKYRRLQSWQP